MREMTEDPAGPPEASTLARRSLLTTSQGAVAFGLSSIIDVTPAGAQGMSNDANSFYVSEQVTVQKVTFENQYHLKVAGNLFVPKNIDRGSSHPAIIVGHPMGAVKEQSSNLYATKLAERGFVTLSLDLSFWGESEGRPRILVSPDIYADDFSAAVDFLGTHPLVDRSRIGVLEICGSGSFAISAAKIDPRMQAIATVSMYDMGSANRNGLRHSQSVEQRKQTIAAAAEQRWAEWTSLRRSSPSTSPSRRRRSSGPHAEEKGKGPSHRRVTPIAS